MTGTHATSSVTAAYINAGLPGPGDRAHPRFVPERAAVEVSLRSLTATRRLAELAGDGSAHGPKRSAEQRVTCRWVP